MLDFLEIVEEEKLVRGRLQYIVKPDFSTLKRTDVMTQGQDFYAIWDEKNKIWSTNESTVIELVDNAVREYCDKHPEKTLVPKLMSRSSSGVIDDWHKYVKLQLRDNFTQLDRKIIFQNSELKKKDYASKCLKYSLEEGPYEAYEELIGTLYSSEERKKLEWSIGSVISGDSKKIQKFIVLYGAPASGKGTFLKILEQLFEGYTATFDSNTLTGKDSFALEAFKDNPLVAIQSDGKLDRIEDNTILNSLVSHETMSVNVKHKNRFPMAFDSFLYMGTNNPVKITDAKSGILRRLIDVYPSGNKIERRRYDKLMEKIPFELGAIASHCLKVYKEMGPHYYDSYVPINMMAATNDFYDFVEYHYYEFSEMDYISLKDAWVKYKLYVEMANVPHAKSYMAMGEEFKEYFEEYYDEFRIPDTGKHIRRVYKGFRKDKFNKNYIPVTPIEMPEEETWLKFTSKVSLFDVAMGDCKAQYATTKGTPCKPWAEVTTMLKDLNTKELHYVKPPSHIISIDFDLKDENGNKSYKKNLEAASKWPQTYAELSKSGEGIHLEYIYEGDPSKLSRVYADDIEIKVMTGNASLRRKLTRCNDLPINIISSGLPLKENNVAVDFEVVKNEKALRTIIKKNLNKEYHNATKPSVDFIFKVLEDAYKSGMQYDVSDMAQAVLCFASKSTHQAETCLNIVSKMHFMSDIDLDSPEAEEKPIIFYDVEVFPNLLLINWKILDAPGPCIRMINPSPIEVEDLVANYRLVGFNCRRYDNHILYARMMGYDNYQIYQLSQRLISKAKTVQNSAMFKNAYNLSYADIYDFMSKKQSLKKWEIELGIHHQELGLPWDLPVPEEKWDTVAEYCDNDVIATEALWKSKECQSDFLARKIIAELSGLTVNDTTNTHSMRIIFGSEKHPQSEFIYPDLSKEFPGYKFEIVPKETKSKDGTITKTTRKVSSYRHVEEIGEGGYVEAKPGIYYDVWVFDVRSMHPHSIKAMNLFGERYTKKFYELVTIRVLIKQNKLEEVSKLYSGKLAKYLNDKELVKGLADALKIVINSIYGLTSASFENPFKDPRNVDNVVAKRGALFMIELSHELSKRGVETIHIKTDSIKISSPSEETKNFIFEFGKKYGYDFEVEHVFSKFCLVNKAVYIAYEANEDHWDATGAQFQQPYVYKYLFSKEPIIFEDLCETKQVQTAISIDMGNEENHDYKFVGRIGSFVPVSSEVGGKMVVEREDKNHNKKYDSVTGTTGYCWLEAEYVKENGLENYIDKSYHAKLVDEALASISEFGDPEIFING